MDLLKQRILNEGTVLPGNILKVDSFLNHQIDTHLAMEMGKEFAKVFSDCKIDRVLTIEASGIAIGFATALAIGVPLVFAKKTRSAVMNDLMYSTEVESFTKKKTNTVFVSKRFLPEGENVLIVDDFLATGAASLGLARLVEMAGSTVAGIGIAVEKSFQVGRQRLEEDGYRIESLARIRSIENLQVSFEE
ncbi:xanthine phosphoribosyltransferase [Dialister micraerophilus]|uniref:Xanthine phosphoribosyltransferase n=1 Tax=Dialister micraerophilus UPII 345-E TaxID=910314 RepID=E4L9H8_9FIRM|nr:xanthine phosphoribosyltransferase [Dialister micraerophilus]EFR42530.1 xanthine phosphoribosyltransferase [Dialister micraerophilus UPII 345-E]MDK8252971.1 xanthine phosphoribosyltransferase [Dialister micraerophilus]